MNKHRNVEDRESIQYWPCGANESDLQSCCPAHQHHFDKKAAHCPDTNLRSFPSAQRLYLETGGALVGELSKGYLDKFLPGFYFSEARSLSMWWKNVAVVHHTKNYLGEHVSYKI